jgi:hypothetical protein
MTLLNDMTQALNNTHIKAETRTELISLFAQAQQDEDEGIRDASKLVALALREKARGWLEQEDIAILLQGQRDMARTMRRLPSATGFRRW